MGEECQEEMARKDAVPVSRGMAEKSERPSSGCVSDRHAARLAVNVLQG